MATFTKLKSGKIRAMVRKSGHYKTKTLPNRTLAKDWAQKFEASLDQKTVGLVTVTHTTVANLIDKFLEEVAVTARSSRYVYRRIAKSQLGKVKLKDLNYQHVDVWVSACLKKAKPNSVRMYCSLMNKVMRWAVAIKRLNVPELVFKEAITRMRFVGLDMSSPPRERTVTEDELRTLHDHWQAKPSEFPMETIVEFAIQTCARINEICRVRAKDYRPEAKTLWLLDRKSPGQATHNTELPLSDRGVDIVEQRIQDGFVDGLFP